MPSYSVPRYLPYQSHTILLPSGFRLGTRRNTTFSSTSAISGLSSVASLWSSSMLIWLPPTSVLCMLQLIIATVFPFSKSSAASSSPSPTGFPSLSCILRSSSRFSRFSGDETVASMKGLPSVVSPSSSTLTRGDVSPTFMKYSTISGQSASLRSVPTLKPRCSSGAGTPSIDMV